MKYKSYLVLILLTVVNLSCSHRKIDKIEAKIYHSVIEKDKDTCNPFETRKLIVELTNNTNDFLFLTDVSNKASAHDYISTRENLGSPEKDLNSKLEEIQDFYTNIENKKGDIKDTVLITIPILENRYQKNHEGDTIDVFYRWDKLNSIYNSKELICLEYPLRVPEPPSEMIQEKDSLFDYLDSILSKEGISNAVERNFLITAFTEETLFFEPREIKVVEYDISEFFLQKATYIFQFIIKDRTENNSLENVDKIYKFKKISDGVISNRIIVISN